MARLSRILFAFPLVAACLLPADVGAQEASTAPAALATEVPSTPSPPPKPKRERPISDNLASALSSSMPKYNPPPKPKPEDEDVDMRDIDKPRNTIIRLPKIVVQERPPVFRERDIYTNKGLSELARRRYLTPTHRLLNSFYIPFLTSSPEEHALAMYAEDERLANMSDLNDTADTISRVDADEGAYIRRVSNETFMRSSDFGYRRKEP